MAWLALTAGCAAIPKHQIAIDRVEFTGNDEIRSRDLEKRMALRESPRFLGTFKGVIYDYELFNRHVLERDVQRIERFYRSRGYYDARVRAGRVQSIRDGTQVRVEIVIDEGLPVLTRRIDVHGLEGLSRELAQDAREAVENALEIGEPFVEDDYEAATKALTEALTDEGYAYVKVRRNADVDVPRRSASVGFWVEPGKIARYGPVTIEGLEGLPEDRVRRAVDLQPGERYSNAEIREAERALLNLGVFGAVTIEADTTQPDQPEDVPIRVKVERARLRSLELGGGLNIDSIKSDVHLTAGWEHRNFLGGLRTLRAEITPGVVFYPTRMPDLDPPERLLPLGRIQLELRQPGLFEARTNGFVRTEASIYPVLITSDPAPDAPILGYRDYRGAVGVDRTISKVWGSLEQNIQVNSPFTYLGPLDPDLGTVLIGYPQIRTTLDLRDDRIRPHGGAYLLNTFQFAGLLSEAVDLKIQPEARGYVPLHDDVTLGLRGTIGLLFPFNYGETLVSNAYAGNPGIASRAAWVRDTQILFLRGFFSGGNGSNRGYGTREIGPHGIVPFYNPGQSSEQLDLDCSDPSGPNYDESSCDLPLGGLTLWEASLELRYRIAGALSSVLFTDTSDVSAFRVDFRLNHPHLSVGLGLRYDTPVGPIRVDVGYRVPGLQYPEGSPDELAEPATTFGQPIAFSFGIGESF